MDDDLLARLNALKPSPITFRQPDAAPETPSLRPRKLEDNLDDRLKLLRSGTSPQPRVGTAGNSRSAVASAVPKSAKDLGSVAPDPIRDWQSDDTDDAALEDLLAELELGEHQSVGRDESQQIASLFAEARNAMPQSRTTEHASPSEGRSGVKASLGADESAQLPRQSNDQEDEDAAVEMVAKIIAEMRLNGSSESADHDNNDEQDHASREFSAGDFELPAVPPELPRTIDDKQNETTRSVDHLLEARFANLGLELPSPPATKPSASKSISAPKLKPGPSWSSHSDEDIDSWCCICNEDGEVKCLDCDSDIYCHNCWRDGHGKGPGQEWGHRAIRFVRAEPS